MPASDPIITPQSIVALFTMVIVGGTVASMIYLGDVSLRGQVLGGVMALGGAVVGYYFGSSKGSADKTAAMVASAPTPPPKP